jgi:predicted transcriptional regulator
MVPIIPAELKALQFDTQQLSLRAVEQVPIAIGRTANLFNLNNHHLSLRAVEQDWTADLFLTKEVLYRWATTA